METMAYDLVIIGSGPGGYSAAVRAAQFGLKTAIVEKDPKLGGTCLHVGCIPTKALLHSASLWQEIQHSAAHGILCDNPRLDFPKIIARKNEVVAKHAKGTEFLMKKNKVDWIKGRGKLLGAGEVEVATADGVQVLETLNVIVATGSEARMLPGLAPDPDTILTNIEILNLQAVPKSLAIIGAGAVGVEFASIFHRFGSKVTLLEMLPRIVPVEDEEISKELAAALQEVGHPRRDRGQGGGGATNRRRRERSRHPLRRQVRDHRSGEAPGRHRPQAQHGRHRSGGHPSPARSRLHPGRRVHADCTSSASTPSATWWPARRNSRTWPPGKAWSPSLTSPAVP